MSPEVLYKRALAHVVEHGDSSCAGLQRNLLIGYERARQLRDALEQDGLLMGIRSRPDDGQVHASPFFKPWIGRHYQKTRLLILGESHYGEEPCPEHATILYTQQYLDGENHRFWTSVMQAVSGQPYWELERAGFWESVAFYNYVQETVAPTAGVAPGRAMFASSAAPFFTVLGRLAPRRMLVASRRLWDNLPEGGRPGPDIECKGAVRETWIYPHAAGETLAMSIPHPSIAFSWQDWHPLIAAFLQDQPARPGQQ